MVLALYMLKAKAIPYFMCIKRSLKFLFDFAFVLRESDIEYTWSSISKITGEEKYIRD